MNATRKIRLWLENEIGTYRYITEIAEDAVEAALGEMEDRTEAFDLANTRTADQIRELVEHTTHDNARNGLTRDLRSHALADVDWHEIAEPHVEAAMEEREEDA